MTASAALSWTASLERLRVDWISGPFPPRLATTATQPKCRAARCHRCSSPLPYPRNRKPRQRGFVFHTDQSSAPPRCWGQAASAVTSCRGTRARFLRRGQLADRGIPPVVQQLLPPVCAGQRLEQRGVGSGTYERRAYTLRGDHRLPPRPTPDGERHSDGDTGRSRCHAATGCAVRSAPPRSRTRLASPATRSAWRIRQCPQASRQRINTPGAYVPEHWAAIGRPAALKRTVGNQRRVR